MTEMYMYMYMYVVFLQSSVHAQYLQNYLWYSTNIVNVYTLYVQYMYMHVIHVPLKLTCTYMYMYMCMCIHTLTRQMHSDSTVGKWE